MKTLVLLLACVVSTLTIAPVKSHASIIPYLDSIAFNGVDYSWSYSVILSGDQNFRSDRTGDFTEISDFRGLSSTTWLSGALLDSDVIIDLQLFGPGSMPPGETDSPVIRNVIVRNGGAAINGLGVDIDLGTLVLTSVFSVPERGAFTSQAQKVADLSTTFNQGYVETPAYRRQDVPEPGTLVTLAIGLVLIGLAKVRFQRRA